MAMANINTEIKETTLKLIKFVSNAIVEDLKDNSGSVLDIDDIIDTMLEAYNMWQEDTHDGVDYIFNINNKDDVIFFFFFDKNIQVSDISSLYINQYNNNGTPYFRYGQNYEYHPKVLMSMKQLKTQLIDNAEWVITHLFLFANNTDTYHKIFNMYIGNLFGA
mgnify:FL=1